MTGKDKPLRRIIRETLDDSFQNLNENSEGYEKNINSQTEADHNCCAEYAHRVLKEIDYPEKDWEAAFGKVLGSHGNLGLWHEEQKKERWEMIERGWSESTPNPYYVKNEAEAVATGPLLEEDSWCCGTFLFALLDEIGYEGTLSEVADLLNRINGTVDDGEPIGEPCPN